MNHCKKFLLIADLTSQLLIIAFFLAVNPAIAAYQLHKCFIVNIFKYLLKAKLKKVGLLFVAAIFVFQQV